MSDGLRNWADLTEGVLDSIIAGLCSFQDLLAFPATCRSWRAAFLSSPFKRTMAALFPPLLLQPDVSLCSPRPRGFGKCKVPTRPCRVTAAMANPDSSSTYQCLEIPIFWIPRKKAPANPLENFCFSGASYGCLIFSSNKSCLIFDAFTGGSVSSPQLPAFEDTGLIYGALTAPLASNNSYLIIEAGSHNLFWRVGSQSWVKRSLRRGPIKQIVVFQGKVFGMDSRHRLFKMQLTPEISIQEVPVIDSSKITLFSDAWLVGCGDMLLLVAIEGNIVGMGRTFKVFHLDLSTTPPVLLKLEKLLNWAIFVSHDKRSQALSCMNPENWGGRSNCIYCYDRWSSKRVIAFELAKPMKGYGTVFVTSDCDRRVQPMWLPNMLSLYR